MELSGFFVWEMWEGSKCDILNLLIIWLYLQKDAA